jgi:hypothetical protein
MTPLVHYLPLATEHNMQIAQLVPMVAYATLMPVAQPLAHYSSLATGHSTLVAQLVPMAAYTLALLTGQQPLAYHWLAVTAHSIPVAAVSAELEVYTEVVQM